MKKFLLREDVKELQEMAAPKLPEGVKKKRDSEWASTHHISVDGEHVATIIGHKPQTSWRGAGRHAPDAGYSTEHGKHYSVVQSRSNYDHKTGTHTPEVLHPDHTVTTTTNQHMGDGEYKDVTQHRAKVYGNMEDAVYHIHAAHKNNKEFGPGHDPKVRWQKAVDSFAGVHEHKRIGGHLQTAVSSLKAAGHHDLAAKAQDAHDAHTAKGPSGASKDDIDRWTHDAYHHSRTKYEGGKGEVPTHPEHHALAKQAYNVRTGHKPDGSYA